MHLLAEVQAPNHKKRDEQKMFASMSRNTRVLSLILPVNDVTDRTDGETGVVAANRDILHAMSHLRPRRDCYGYEWACWRMPQANVEQGIPRFRKLWLETRRKISSEIFTRNILDLDSVCEPIPAPYLHSEVTWAAEKTLVRTVEWINTTPRRLGDPLLPSQSGRWWDSRGHGE